MRETSRDRINRISDIAKERASAISAKEVSEIKITPRTETEFKKAAVEARIKEIKEELPHLYAHGGRFYTWSREFFESRNRVNLLTAANQIGKLLKLQEKIPTPLGWRKMEDLSIGDEVFGRDGRPTKIIAIPFIGEDQIYRITFNDHTTVEAGSSHMWVCKGYNERFRKKYTAREKTWGNPTYLKWVEKSTKEIVDEGRYAPETKATRRFSIPIASAAEYAERELFDPYYVGLYVGNGSGRVITFHGEDRDLINYSAKYGNERINRSGRSRGSVSVVNPHYKNLQELGVDKLSYEKEIPESYLLGSVEQRKSLLAGLLDTDGSFEKSGHTTFSTTSKVLSRQFETLVCSLGGMAQTRQRKAGYRKDGVYKECHDCYETMIWTEFNPFRSLRKSSKWVPRHRTAHERVIIKIEPLGRQMGKCITVDNEDGTFLCTENYIVTHNSTIAIRKNIEWAGNPKLWPELWPTIPIQFWYFYPSNAVATNEFKTKWVPEYLPRGSAKSHKTYGWKEEMSDGDISAIHFNSGCSIYFKTYAQKAENLQTATVHMITADEEMPETLTDEILVRLRATRGYFNQVFTATQGYQLWFKAMECQGTSEETFVGAAKWQVSLYDCLKYDDGSPGHYTMEMAEEAVRACTSKNEELKRVWGRFVKDGGLKYFGFTIDKNVTVAEPYPADWSLYAGVDIGSGGAGVKRSLAAIVFLIVNPQKTRGRIIKLWRGDGQDTSSGDILRQYQVMKKAIGRNPISACYDYQSREFGITASRSREPFIQADKRRDAGEKTLNDLFAAGALTIDKTADDAQKLITELVSVPAGSKLITRRFVDDLVDALRYAVFQVPWDMGAINPGISAPDPKKISTLPDGTWTNQQYDEWQIRMRRGEFEEEENGEAALGEYINELNSYYGE